MHMNAIIKTKERKRKEEKTSEWVSIKPVQKLTQGAPALHATKTITPVENVICQPLSQNIDFFVLAVFLHTLFLENETQIGGKKCWTMFYN